MEGTQFIQYDYLNEDITMRIKKLYTTKNILNKYFLKLNSNNDEIKRVLRISYKSKVISTEELVIFNKYSIVIFGEVEIDVIYSSDNKLGSMFNNTFKKEFSLLLDINLKANERIVDKKPFNVCTLINSGKCIKVEGNSIEVYVVNSIVVFD